MNSSFKSVYTLYIAMLGGMMMIGFLLAFIIFGTQQEGGLHSLYVYLAGLITIGSVVLGFFIYNQRLKEGAKLSGLEEKLVHFRETSIVRWALIEGAALLSLLFMFLEQNYLYLVFFAIAILAFLQTRPSIESFAREYKLTSEEEYALRKS